MSVSRSDITIAAVVSTDTADRMIHLCRHAIARMSSGVYLRPGSIVLSSY